MVSGTSMYSRSSPTQASMMRAERQQLQMVSTILLPILHFLGIFEVSNSIELPTYHLICFPGESGSERVQRFKRWFWSIVERMTPIERQDLVYFWTSSPALPASEGGFQPMPSITVRPPDDTHLPTANTCISRLYIPLYSTKAILRAKLLHAIKTKAFGFV